MPSHAANVMGNRRVYAEVIQLGNSEGGRIEWKVHVGYDADNYLVVIYGETITVYVERELPESRGLTMAWPTHVTGIRAAAIECVRRMRFGETG